MSMDIRALAYLVAETTDVAAWKTYAEQVVGAMTEPTAEGGLLVKIDERQQRMVIRHRYGIDECELLTLEELAERLELTRERVRQIQLEALGQLRRILRRRGIPRDALL